MDYAVMFESVLLVRVTELFIRTLLAIESWVASDVCAVRQAGLGRFAGAVFWVASGWPR